MNHLVFRWDLTKKTTLQTCSGQKLSLTPKPPITSLYQPGDIIISPLVLHLNTTKRCCNKKIPKQFGQWKPFEATCSHSHFKPDHRLPETDESAHILHYQYSIGCFVFGGSFLHKPGSVSSSSTSSIKTLLLLSSASISQTRPEVGGCGLWHHL